MFIVLISRIVNVCNHTKCVTLSNQKFKIQPIIVILHPNEFSQERHYYSFSVELDSCFGSSNTLNDLPNKIYILNKTEYLNLSVFSMIKGTNEWKILTKHISCECKCGFDGKNVFQINGGITM